MQKKKQKSEGAVLVTKTDEDAFAAAATERCSDALSAKKKKNKHHDSDWEQCRLYVGLCYTDYFFKRISSCRITTRTVWLISDLFTTWLSWQWMLTERVSLAKCVQNSSRKVRTRGILPMLKPHIA